ncbi:MAG: lactonase family protein [Planctomycetales bacterium]|nr:lactonase family protein [Planctomycetales bacterium]
MRRSLPFLLQLLFVVMLTVQSNRVRAENFHVYIGTYSGPSSKGIYLSEFDSTSGNLGPAELVAEMKHPSFVAINPEGTHLYAVSETGDHVDGDRKSGAIHAFRINQANGELVALNSVLSGGAAPCHIVVDHSGKYVLAANYTGGNASVHEINDDGTLGQRTAFVQHNGSSANKQRQEAAHAHSINVDAGNKHAFVADLGLDKILIYDFDANAGTLSPSSPAGVDLPPGSGPRHFSFHPSGKFAYVINELSLTVTAFSYDAESGVLSTLQAISTLPDGITDRAGMSTAEVLVHPTGKFVYGSNRGYHSIVVYSVDENSGMLTYVENKSTQGETPRNFAIDPTGKFLLAENQSTNSVVVFSIDQNTGELTATGTQIEVGSPVCIRFLKHD